MRCVSLVRGRSLRLVKASRKTQLELSEENFLSATAVFINNYINKHI